MADRTNPNGAYDINLHWAVRGLADGIANEALSVARDPASTRDTV